MKIAIQSNKQRGKEIISLLESLGGNNTSSIGNTLRWKGDAKNPMLYYYIDENSYVQLGLCPENYKPYTLEEFEKEFPFKVGDLCIYSSNILGEDIVVKILGMAIKNDCIMYEVGHKNTTVKHSHIYKEINTLKPYKEMKEERNITLTLEKAKEWYKKGGDLKEVALQAYTEEELKKVELPKTWDDYLRKTCFIWSKMDQVTKLKEVSPRYAAQLKLEYLRDHYRQGWKPNWEDANMTKYAILKDGNKTRTATAYSNSRFLSFQSREIAEEFLSNFKDLIKEVGDLI